MSQLNDPNDPLGVGKVKGGEIPENLKGDQPFQGVGGGQYDYVARDRGGCLTAFLVVIIGANIFMLISLIAQYSSLDFDRYRYQLDEPTLRTVFMISFVIQFAILASAIALWNWKKLGYYGLIAGYLVGGGLNLFSGNVALVLGSIIGLVILISLLKDKQHMLE